MSKIEQTIINNLICSEEYARKALPFLELNYFTSNSEKQLFKIINAFVETYNKMPTKEVISVSIDKLKGLSEDQYKEVKERVDNLVDLQPENIDWLLQETEKHCQDKAIYNAIVDSIEIIDNEKKDIGRGAIPELLTKALSVSFDTNIGHDYTEDAESRYEFYHRKDTRVEFDIELLNNITKGGLKNKTLAVLLAGSGVGKSALMCHFAANNIGQGKNVLYITMEMSEEEISKRIDANRMNVTMDDLEIMPKETFLKKISSLKSKGIGKLIVKEYPTSSAGSAHFRHLLNELRLKKNFVPDIIYVDYINICSSSRIKMGGSVNSYSYIKSIAEEIRALAVEFNVPIVSATQSNRDGYCLDPNTMIRAENEKKQLKDIKIGDKILSNSGYNVVVNVFSKTEKVAYKIKTSSGKEIICSGEHLFPIENFSEISINKGLSVGDKIHIYNK